MIYLLIMAFKSIISIFKVIGTNIIMKVILNIWNVGSKYSRNATCLLALSPVDIGLVRRLLESGRQSRDLTRSKTIK